MLKSELIDLIAGKQPHLSHADVTAVVNNILEQMTQELATGGRIEIRGFGTFSLRYRPTRVSRNPKTGEAVSVEQKHFVHFKPGTELKQRVDKSSKQYPILL
jgi:integration host factor subunit beta